MRATCPANDMVAEKTGWPVVSGKYLGTCIRVSRQFQPTQAITDLHVSGYPGKSLVAVYPGRTSLSRQTSPGKRSNPGIRAKPGHPGNHWSQLVPAGTSWVPAGTSWYQLVPADTSEWLWPWYRVSWAHLSPQFFGWPPHPTISNWLVASSSLVGRGGGDGGYCL